MTDRAMPYRPLGDSDLKISLIGLGSMTWGEQNSQEEAFAQLDYAVGEGVNFIDTAELYPVPPKAETYGETERIIGAWLKARGGREKHIIASKVTGPSGMGWIRGGSRLVKDHIVQAVEGSLKRLATDYIDLYQLHWPARQANFFGRLDYKHDQGESDAIAPIEEQLETLHNLKEQGKIRHVGLSNETPWGVVTFLRLAQARGWPRMQSVQNPYNLLNRSFEVGLAEIAIRERCGLLAYSPLGFGVLSGKYKGGAKPQGARLTLFDQFQRYLNPRAVSATERYVALAEEHGIAPAVMALAFINSRPFVTSNIIGATTMAQLRLNIESARTTLPPALLEALDAIHGDNPNPAP